MCYKFLSCIRWKVIRYRNVLDFFRWRFWTSSDNIMVSQELLYLYAKIWSCQKGIIIVLNFILTHRSNIFFFWHWKTGKMEIVIIGLRSIVWINHIKRKLDGDHIRVFCNNRLFFSVLASDLWSYLLSFSFWLRLFLSCLRLRYWTSESHLCYRGSDIPSSTVKIPNYLSKHFVKLGGYFLIDQSFICNSHCCILPITENV